MSWFTLRSLRLAVLVSVVTLTAPGAALAKTEIHFWHAMTGQLGERVNEIAKQFNASQNEYEVKPLLKGTYPETLNAAIAAYRAKQAPHIVQVFEVGTQTMLLVGRGPIRSTQLMKEQEIAIDWKDLIGPVGRYYSKDGNLYSMPFNSSTPILYYNKDAFKKAGLDPTSRRRPGSRSRSTGQEAHRLGRRQVRLLAPAGRRGSMVENMHAWHDQPFATKHNGFDGLDASS